MRLNPRFGQNALWRNSYNNSDIFTEIHAGFYTKIKTIKKIVDIYFTKPCPDYGRLLDQGAHHLNVNVFDREKLVDTMGAFKQEKLGLFYPLEDRSAHAGAGLKYQRDS